MKLRRRKEAQAELAGRFGQDEPGQRLTGKLRDVGKPGASILKIEPCRERTPDGKEGRCHRSNMRGRIDPSDLPPP